MAENRNNQGPAGPNEGEGNKTAARHYNQGVQQTTQSGKVEQKAREARDALAGSEGRDLARAEAEGKSHAHGEDPALHKKK